jgi:voltage-gated potassium channel Kch
MLRRFIRSFVRSLEDEEFRPLFILVAVLLIAGTIFYSSVEGWGVVDSLYFSVITLTTIGYGDLHPTTPLSKVFTIIYVMVGIGAFVVFVRKLAENAVTRKGGHRMKDKPGGRKRYSRRRTEGAGPPRGGVSRDEKG